MFLSMLAKEPRAREPARDLSAACGPTQAVVPGAHHDATHWKRQCEVSRIAYGSAAGRPAIGSLHDAAAMLRPSPAGARMTPGRSFLPILDLIARWGAAIVVCVGAAVVFGWYLHIQTLKSVIPGFETMKINTALGFVISGSALWFLHTSTPGSNARYAVRTLALCVIAISALTLAQDISAHDFGIDQLIMRDIHPGAQALHPGRMAPVTGVCFLTVGIALLGLKSRHPRVAIFAHWLTLLPLFLSLLAIMGYAYGVRSLYEVKPFSSMAGHTALVFFILTLSIKAADPMHGIANIIASDTAGGLLCRRLLPTVPLALFVLGYLSLLGQRAGYYDTVFGLALMVSVSIIISVLAVVLTAYTLRKVDLTRRQAQSEILDLNHNIEEMLRQRTQQVSELSAALAENQSLAELSLHDGLTHIANRRFFDTYLAGQIAIARRNNRPLALVLCDVDEFKSYNDRYGHPAGDACLVKIAAALQACCQRAADMAARYGGEEFALILPDTDLAGAEWIAETVRDTVSHLGIEHARSGAGSRVSISGGIAVWKMDMTSEDLIAAADQSLFRAKHEGRNRMISARAA
jgi:diguanylate cyclase (GGDEF)-like protein